MRAFFLLTFLSLFTLESVFSAEGKAVYKGVSRNGFPCVLELDYDAEKALVRPTSSDFFLNFIEGWGACSNSKSKNSLVLKDTFDWYTSGHARVLTVSLKNGRPDSFSLKRGGDSLSRSLACFKATYWGSTMVECSSLRKVE